jgi:hypothetical protein
MGEDHLRVVLGRQGHLKCLKPPPRSRENGIGGWKRELEQKNKNVKVMIKFSRCDWDSLNWP